MSDILNNTLIDFLNNSSTVCIPQGYDKAFPQQSVDQPGFVPNDYYKLFKSLANAEQTFEYFKYLANLILDRPFNPLECNQLLLDALKNILGINFITEDLDEQTLRQVLYAKLLANINNGTINNTIEIFQTLLDAKFVRRIRLGGVNVSYCAIAGDLPITLDELQTFWDQAKTGGIFIELRKAPLGFFGFFGDPDALGFATLSGTGLIIRKINPYFGFYSDPNAHGFATVDSPTVGGYMATLVLPSQGGGNMATIIYGEQGAS